jgi:hypothetical protein
MQKKNNSIGSSQSQDNNVRATVEERLAKVREKRLKEASQQQANINESKVVKQTVESITQQPIKTSNVKVQKGGSKKSPIFAMMSVFAITLIGTSLTLSYLEVSNQSEGDLTAENKPDVVKPMEHYTVASNLTDVNTNVEAEQNESFLQELHANTMNTPKMIDEKQKIVDNSQSGSKADTLDDLVITLGENNNDQTSEKETTASKPSLDVPTKQESQLDEKEDLVVFLENVSKNTQDIAKNATSSVPAPQNETEVSDKESGEINTPAENIAQDSSKDEQTVKNDEKVALDIEKPVSNEQNNQGSTAKSLFEVESITSNNLLEKEEEAKEQARAEAARLENAKLEAMKGPRYDPSEWINITILKDANKYDQFGTWVEVKSRNKY